MQSFVARDDDGNEFTIVSETPRQSWGDSSGGGVAPKRRTLRTDDGKHVEWKEQGVYEIVDDLTESRTRVTSADPNAP